MDIEKHKNGDFVVAMMPTGEELLGMLSIREDKNGVRYAAFYVGAANDPMTTVFLTDEGNVRFRFLENGNVSNPQEGFFLNRYWHIARAVCNGLNLKRDSQELWSAAYAIYSAGFLTAAEIEDISLINAQQMEKMIKLCIFTADMTKAFRQAASNNAKGNSIH